MRIENNIGSIIQGNEYVYIYNHFKNNSKSILYVARNDKEIYSISEKLQWFLPKKKNFII